MNKKDAVRIARVLNDYASTNPKRFRVARVASNRPLSGFHRWANERPLVAADLVERADGSLIHVLLIDWKSDGEYYCVLFPKNRSNPHAEIRTVEKTGAHSVLRWTYTPRKKDASNSLRRERFHRSVGADSLEIVVPTDVGMVPRFLGGLFDLVAKRSHADLLPDASQRAQRPDMQGSDEIPDNPYLEGAALRVVINAFERSPAARAECIAHFGARCVVCGFDASNQYGPEVAGLIHVHHLTPLASIMNVREVDPVRDLRPVCPNCHAAMHRVEPPYTPDELRAMMNSVRNVAADAPVGDPRSPVATTSSGQ